MSKHSSSPKHSTPPRRGHASRSSKRFSQRLDLVPKTCKIFAVEFHGPVLKRIEEEIIKQMEQNVNKKIYFLGKKGEQTPTPKGRETPTEEYTLFQILEGLERCKRDCGSLLRKEKTLLIDDIKSYWKNKKNENVSESESEDEENMLLNTSINSEKGNEKMTKLFDLNIDEIEVSTDYFVIIFCHMSAETVIGLLDNQQPLQAIIHFIPCPTDEVSDMFPDLQKDVDVLRKTPKTKNVGIFLHPINLPYDEINITQAIYSYNHLLRFLYDIEMLTKQHIVYEKTFQQINVDRSTEDEYLLMSKFLEAKEDSDKRNKDINDDKLTVGLFMDDLLEAVSNAEDSFVVDGESSQIDVSVVKKVNSDQLDSVCHLSPFLENNYKKVIVEKHNELLQSAVVSELNIVSYWKLVYFLRSLLRNCHFYKYLNEELDLEMIKFYELMSWEAFVQRLEFMKTVYDKCLCVDLSDDCKLFTLRRTFRSIVESGNEFQLPTRLCFRDFCYCLTARNKTLSLMGILFDETLQELITLDILFRFDEFSIFCLLDVWTIGEKMRSMKFQFFNNFLYYYHTNSNPAKLRLITNDDLVFNVESYEESDYYPNIDIHYPNGCNVEYIHEDDMSVVRQSYTGSESESSRLYTAEGCVIRFLTNGIKQVLTPYGVIYTLLTKEPSFMDMVESDTSSNQSESSARFQREIGFVKSLKKYEIYCAYFEVTLNDGRKLRMSTQETFVEQIDVFMNYEWIDWRHHKKFLDRDDGVKMIWSINSFKCYYPCGTVITTRTVDDVARTNFICETNIMSNIFKNTNPVFVAKGANKAKKEDSYVTYNLNYSIQHENYATVMVCGRDKMEIHLPGESKLIVKEEIIQKDDESHNLVVVEIDIGKELTFRIAAGVCTVYSGISTPKDKEFVVKLNMFPAKDENILSVHCQDVALSMDPRGEMKLIDKDAELTTRDETIYFLAKKYLFGIEIISEAEYEKIISKSSKEKYFYNSPNQTVILTAMLPMDKRFSMLESNEISNDLKYFKPTLCHNDPKQEDAPNHVLISRVINKIDGNENLSILEFIESINFNETTLANLLNEALDFLFGVKEKSQHPKWKAKIKDFRVTLEYNKERMRIYRKMLQDKHFPCYFEFKNCGYNIKYLNLEKFEKGKKK